MIFIETDNNTNMKTPLERKTELSVMKANMSAMGMFLSCLRTAFVLLGIAFVLIKLNADGKMGGYSITMIVLASVIAIVGLCNAIMFKRGICKVDDDSERI